MFPTSGKSGGAASDALSPRPSRPRGGRRLRAGGRAVVALSRLILLVAPGHNPQRAVRQGPLQPGRFRPRGPELVLQPGFTWGPSALAPVTFAGGLLVAATPRRPVLEGCMSGRLFPDQMPQQASDFRHGERQK